jgi:hypothetical protein
VAKQEVKNHGAFFPDTAALGPLYLLVAIQPRHHQSGLLSHLAGQLAGTYLA